MLLKYRKISWQRKFLFALVPLFLLEEMALTEAKERILDSIESDVSLNFTSSARGIFGRRKRACLIYFGPGSTSVISRLGNRRTDIPYFTTRHFLPLSRLRDDFLGCSRIFSGHRIMYKRKRHLHCTAGRRNCAYCPQFRREMTKDCKKKIARSRESMLNSDTHTYGGGDWSRTDLTSSTSPTSYRV